MRTALICNVGFSSFGRTFVPGEEIPTEVAASWPEGTLTNRLRYEFCVYKTLDENGVPEGEKPNGPEPLPDHGDLTKRELVEFAMTHFGAELDAGQPRATLIEAVDALIATGKRLS